MGISRGDNDPAPREPFAGVAGIGPKRAAALQRAGVPDRAVLARGEDPQDLADRLRSEGIRGVSADEVARWVKMARELEGAAAARGHNDIRGVQPEPPEEMLEGWTHTAAFTIWFAYRPAPDRAPEWRSYVYHEEGAGEWEVLDGVETWAAWVADRAGIPEAAALLEEPAASEEPAAWTEPPPPAEPAPPREPPAPPTPAAEPLLDVVAIDISRRGGVPPGIEARILLRLAPALQALAAERGSLSYAALVEILDPASGTVLAERLHHGRLAAGQPEPAVACTLAFPPPGRYRLRTRIRIEPDGQTAERDGPEVTVT